MPTIGWLQRPCWCLPIGPTGFLRKRFLAYASAIESSRSGTCSPNRFSLFERLARSWFFLFTFAAHKTWMFLSSSLVSVNDRLIRNCQVECRSVLMKANMASCTSACPAPPSLWAAPDACSWSPRSAASTFSRAPRAAPSGRIFSSAVLHILSARRC